MNVSVIMPVYNAEHFVQHAVESALQQEEVNQVVLIEDGSTDDSLTKCRELAIRHSSVQLLTHEGGTNKGASISRNIGLRAANEEYVAFLDADDIYLPGRFNTARQIFQDFADVDGVYETIGASFDNDDLKAMHLDRLGSERTGLKKLVTPDELFRYLARGTYGHIHLNGLVCRRRSLEGIEFDPKLTQSQDVDFILRLSADRKLFPGNLSHDVAVRGVHGGNRVFNKDQSIKFRRMYLRKAMRTGFYNRGSRFVRLAIVTRYIRLSLPIFKNHYGLLVNIFLAPIVLVYLICHPRLSYEVFAQAPDARRGSIDDRIFRYGQI